MKLLKLQSIVKKNIPLHYRNEFSGIALFHNILNPGNETEKHAIEFAIERTALGKTDISVKIKGDLGYPLVPVLKTLKLHIIELDKEGLLP